MRSIRFTKQGYEDLKAEIEKLHAERIHAVAELKTAREMGDLSENAAYKVARSRLSSIDGRLRHVERIMKRVQVIERRPDEAIDIGSEVILATNSQEMTVILVDGYESDFAKGKISVFSPIGRAIRGKQKGDKVIVKTPGGMKEYRIVSAK